MALTDSPGGTAQNTYTYEPYGVTGISGTVPNPWQFASGYHDSTNWYKFGMRYYAARLGRWSQRDSKEQPTDPVQADRYGYAGGDPVNNVDPNGLSCKSYSKKAGLGPVLGYCSGGAISAGVGGEPFVGVTSTISIDALNQTSWLTTQCWGLGTQRTPLGSALGFSIDISISIDIPFL